MDYELYWHNIGIYRSSGEEGGGGEGGKGGREKKV